MTQDVLKVSEEAHAQADAAVDRELQLANVLLDAKMTPDGLRTPGQVIAVMQQGKELGLSPMSALGNIVMVQGRPTLGIHLIAARIRQHKVQYELIEDFVFIREDGTADKVKQTETVTVKDANGNDVKKRKSLHNYVDMRTTIRFTSRSVVDGSVQVQDISFTWNEAKSQDLTQKKVWQRMPIIMMRTRCLAVGARFVCPEAIMNLLETTEAADAYNVNLNITDEGGYAALIED